MAATLVQSSEGVSALATTTASFAVAPTSGNLVVLAFAGDDYNNTPNAGWTQSAEMEQQTFHGGYIWWRISDGSNSLQYTIGSATNSAWVLAEFSGVDAAPYDTSQGKFIQSSDVTIATDVITPSTGQRLLCAMIGGSLSLNLAAETISFSDSFTLANTIGTGGGGTNDVVGLAYRIVTGNGATTFSTTGTYINSMQSRSALIISFKEAAGAAVAYLRPDGDTATDGWTDASAGTSNIFQSVDEASVGDADYVQSPSITSGTSDLTVRLCEGITTIATWTHSNIGTSFTTAIQTLTTPQFAAITDFSNLFVEFDDGSGNVYRCQMGNPAAGVAEPVKLHYRFKKLAA